MEFLVVIAFIVLIVKYIKVQRKYEKLDAEMELVKRQLQDLYNKSFFVYDCMKKSGIIETPQRNENEMPQEKPADVVVQQPAAVTLQQAAAAEKVQFRETSPGMEAHKAFGSESVPTPVKPEAPAQSPYVAAAVSEPIFKDEPQETPQHAVREAVRPPIQHAPPKPKPKKRIHVEEWLGARIFNIAASLLIFIGLTMFCTLSTDQVTNTMKMIAMFAVSGGFIAVGAFLSRKDKSIFPLGMLGCGFGTFFITILISHIYFLSMNDISAFGLILVWSAFALYMSKRLNSVMLSVTAHIGTAISICFAYSLGFTPKKVLILTIYQLAAIAVIILGNIFCCRRTYRFGLIMSQCLLLYTSIAMSVAFRQMIIMPMAISPVFAAVIYGIQFLSLSFISYLVATSAGALEKEGGKFVTISTVIHLANKLLWIGGTIASVGCITYFICKNALNTATALPISLAVCTAALLHLILSLLMEMKLNFSSRLTGISIWFISLMITFALFVGAQNTGLPFVFVYALLLIVIFKYTKNKGIAPIAAAVLIIEAVYMTFYGYFRAENVWVSIPYMFAMGVVLLILWFVQNGEDKQKYFKYMKISEYLWISVSIIAINASEFSDISIPLILSEFALMNIICYFIKFGSENEPELRVVVKAESILTVYIGIFALGFEQIPGALGSNNIIKAVLVVMIAAITAVYVYDFARRNSTFLQTVAAFTTACFFTLFAIGFQDHFKLLYIYADILYCKPFLFIFTAMLVLICFTKCNKNLDIIIWIGMILDMLMMAFSGYGELAHYCVYKESLDVPLHIITTGVSLAHAAALLGASFLMNNLIEESTPSIHKRLNISRYVSYFWINVSFPTIIYYAFYKTSFNNYKLTFALIVLTLVNAAVFALGYQGEHSSGFNKTVRVTSAIILYSTLPFYADGRMGTNGEYAACVVLLLSCTALFFLHSREIMRGSKPTWAQVYIGLTSTIFFNCACNGLTDKYDATFIFSIISMITALICITIGFIAKAKGLRIYGLIVTMLCIIKLVTIDISSADSLARVVAFIIGGIICFIISGIYNRVEKKLTVRDSVGDE